MKHNILHVVHSLEIGGLERVIVTLFNGIDPQRFESHVCCIRLAGELASLLDDPSRMHVIGHHGRIDLPSLAVVGKIIREFDIDLVHTHNFPGLLYSYAAAKLRRLPIIHTQHGRILREESHILNRIEKILSRSVNKYVCVSGKLKEDVSAAIKIKEDRLSLIYNGINVPEVQSQFEDKKYENITIGSIGRFDPIKNYKMLVEAFSMINKKFPECRLEIVGGGECYDELSERVTSLSLGDSASLPGYQMDVFNYMKRFDIYVLPSFSEGHSISLLEAMGSGKICIASNVGGNPEIVTDGVNGLLFDPYDLQDLVSKIIYVIEHIDEPEMNTMRANARESILSNYSSQTMLARYDQIYGELLNDD